MKTHQTEERIMGLLCVKNIIKTGCYNCFLKKRMTKSKFHVKCDLRVYKFKRQVMTDLSKIISGFKG
ncbi:MAG: hypothetical protein A2381_14790 [Bdellovibrionales bacterium RIFOXYB1_FULL_37_110]|nr:MAG: hypothetical protein A2417_10295 [Bdellovibrionales bacterium RIFOXYC1_FULL_37_79]OFZ60132.1 MAG: hypothetical protein A2381_14790 [Bdellovibrionales bacterium RIFOXYB1_FULL_37_110]OFZ64374.1 MAG: hypothetical protein A2577_09980 [Bdellovibrionales bacterium RIFOXYD1_FULL_36_51]